MEFQLYLMMGIVWICIYMIAVENWGLADDHSPKAVIFVFWIIFWFWPIVPLLMIYHLFKKT
jgi:hypothetical protein